MKIRAGFRDGKRGEGPKGQKKGEGKTKKNEGKKKESGQGNPTGKGEAVDSKGIWVG